MKLTPEQLDECQKEFEADWRRLASYGVSAAKEVSWTLYQAAWRPRLTWIYISDIAYDHTMDREVSNDIAEAIYCAMGGNDE